MAGEVDCRPSRIILASRTPIPESITRGLSAELGVRVEWSRRASCNPGEVVIARPGSYKAPGSGGCLFIEFPHLALLPLYLGEASRDWCRLWNDPERLYYDLAMELAGRIRGGYETPWRGPPRIPKRPPPILVASEVYVGGLRDPLAVVAERISSGADLVVVSPSRDIGGREYLGLVKRIAGEYSVDVFVDPAGLISPEEAYSAGSTGWMSLTRCELEAVDESVRGEMAYVIIPRRLGGPEDRFRELVEAYREAQGLGYRKIMLDPVLQPLIHPGALPGLVTAYRLGSEGYGPLLLGVNNVYELIDADTTGTIPLLVSLAGEAGASVVLVTEESRKARGATLEARVASELASLSLAFKTPPKDYPYRLLVSKDKGRSLLGATGYTYSVGDSRINR